MQGLPLVKPPYGRITAHRSEQGRARLADRARRDAGQHQEPSRRSKASRFRAPDATAASARSSTKTLVIAGEGGFFTPPTAGAARCCARTTRRPAQDAGAVYMPAPQTGSPMTYMLNGKQYMVLAIGGGNYQCRTRCLQTSVAVVGSCSRGAVARSYSQRPTRSVTAQAPVAPATASCPGQAMPVQLATGIYTAKPVPDIVINGQPAPGAIWKPGERAYWHCHTGGQLLFCTTASAACSSAASARARCARATLIGRPRASSIGTARHRTPARTSFRPSPYEHNVVDGRSGRDDYLGNDVGINSRNEFLRTGVRKKN